MRGKVVGIYETASNARITPAHAGKSIRCPHSSQKSGDHPRTCGEKYTLSTFFAEIRGSPPHMRGKGDMNHFEEDYERITPAHAGKRIPLLKTETST